MSNVGNKAQDALAIPEQELRLVVDTIPTLVWTAAPGGDIEYVNKRVLEYFGAPLGEIVGWGWAERVHPEDVAFKVGNWLNSLESENPHNVACRFRGADGRYRWFNVRGEPLRANDGTVLSWYGVLIDIDDQRKAEAALRESEHKLRQIFETEPALIWSTDFDSSEGKKAEVRPGFVPQLQAILNVLPAYTWYAAPRGALTFVNKRTGDYLGIPNDHPLRFGIDTGAEWDHSFALLHPDDREDARKYWSSRLRTGEGGEHNYRVRSAQGDYRWFLTRMEPLRASDGTLLLWVGATLDIEELMRAQEALRESEQSLQTIIDTIPAIVTRYRPDGTPDFMNQTLRELVGPGAVIDVMNNTVHPDDLSQRLRDWPAHVAAGEPYENEMRVRPADGVYRWYRMRRVPLRDANGTIVNWYGAGYDIDDQKRSETALRESEYKLRQIIETVPSHLWSASPAFEPTHLNQHLLDYFGRGFEDFQHGGWEAFIHPDDLPETAKALSHAVQTGTYFDVVHRLRRADGEFRWHHARGEPLRDRQGNIIQWYGLSVDIDEAKKAEDRLRRSEAYLTEAQRLSHTGTWVLNPTTMQYLYWSNESYRIWGFDPLQGLPSRESLWERIHDRDRVWEKVQEALRQKKDYSGEFKIVLPNGIVKYLAAASHHVFSTNGELVEVIGTNVDVTDRKRAEQALRESEAKIRRLVDANIIGVFVWDSEGGIIEANDAFLRIVNYDREDLVSGRLRRTELTPPDWLETNERRLAELKAAGTVQPYEKEYFRKDGSRVPVLIGAAAFDTAIFDERVNQGVAFVLDLTERKRSEDALKKSEAELIEAKRELQATIDTIPIPVASYSADAKRDFVNAAWKQYTGLSDEAALGTEWSVVAHPDHIATGEKMWRDALAKGEPWHTEERVRRFDGQYRWFAIDRVAARDESGKVIKWYGTAYDIEDRKRAEDALRRSRAYLDEAQRLSVTGSFGWRIADNLIVWSRETYRIFELDPAVKPTIELVFGRTHPDDIELVRDMIERMAHEDRDFDFEHRLLLPDGTIKHLHVRTHRVRFESGEVEIVGAVMDVTTARKGEEALRRAQAELAHAARVATLGELSASIAHEVNQPLASIVASGEAAIRWLDRDVPEKERAQRAIMRLLNEAQRASQVIRRIRELAKKAEPEMAQVDINNLVEDAVTLVHREAAGQRATVCTQLASELPPVRGDRIQLQQVLINLAINGIQAMASVTDRARELVIRTQRRGDDELLVAVEDAGVGIAPENLDRLFGAFYTTKPDGMGMGLSISRSIVEAHGGQIWATRNSGPGMTFQFTVSAHREQTAA